MHHTITDNRQFGLIGKNISYSFSKTIHEAFNQYSYQIFDLDERELKAFLHNELWTGLNVTTPYKITALQYAHTLSKEVQNIGACNMLVRDQNNRITAYNTDVFGFEYLLKTHFDLESEVSLHSLLEHKRIGILGSGGACRAVFYVLKRYGADIRVFSRNSNGNALPNSFDILNDCIAPYPELAQFNPQILINTTPLGMNKTCAQSPLDSHILNKLKDLQHIIDLNYNPPNPLLSYQALSRNIAYSNGLAMLVAQAAKACELFSGHKPSLPSIQNITALIADDLTNLVLVGMPGVGKTTQGQLLAQLTGRDFYDTDELFFKQYGIQPHNFILQHGDELFRQYELSILEKLYYVTGCIISTGGGIVSLPKARSILTNLGTVILLQKPLDELVKTNRPLSYNLENLYNTRLPWYTEVATITYTCSNNPPADAQRILSLVHNKHRSPKTYCHTTNEQL